MTTLHHIDCLWDSNNGLTVSVHQFDCPNVFVLCFLLPLKSARGTLGIVLVDAKRQPVSRKPSSQDHALRSCSLRPHGSLAISHDQGLHGRTKFLPVAFFSDVPIGVCAKRSVGLTDCPHVEPSIFPSTSRVDLTPGAWSCGRYV
jgi:hypothetical protein